jgi:5-hydroxyisourate hydrolase
MNISTHVLDTAHGRPAAGVAVTLSHRGAGGSWSVVGSGVTDADGRIRELAGGQLGTGAYRLEFATGAYFERSGTKAFYPEVAVVFEVSDAAGHFHVPLLLSPFGYTTYRGT